MNRRTLYVGIGVIAVLAAVTAVMYLTRSRALLGAVMNPPWPAPEVTLTDHNGKPFSMTGQRGKVVLLYFGYVNCPDECPLTMAHIKLALEGVGEQSKDVQVVMVSTDPPRDTPQALQEFMAKFDPTFLGLTGDSQQLQQAWKDYGVTVEDGGETHSTYLYVIDPAGDVRETFLPDLQPADLANDLKILLSGG